MSLERNEQSVHNYFKAVTRMNADAWADLFAPDALSTDPVGSPPVVTREARKHAFLGLVNLIHVFDMTPDYMYLAGNEAAVKWSARGRGHNGAAFTCEGIDVFTFNEQGQIQNLRGFWNPASVMALLSA